MGTPINGTTLQLYSNGTCFAMQKGLSIGIDCDLPDSTNKESDGWAEHIEGFLNAKIDFSSLFSTGLMTDTPAVLSAKGLMDYVLTKKDIIVAILGGTVPIIGKADINSFNFDAPTENVMNLSGSLKINGRLFILISGADVNLLTDPDESGTDYDTFTLTATAINSAINAAGTASVYSNAMALVSADVVRVFFYLTKTSGQLPTVDIYDFGVTSISNIYQTVEGLNVFDLTLTGSPSASAVLHIANTGAASFKCSSIYVFKL